MEKKNQMGKKITCWVSDLGIWSWFSHMKVKPVLYGQTQYRAMTAVLLEFPWQK